MLQAVALFDIRVIDTDTRSYIGQSLGEVLISFKNEKRSKHEDTCEERRALFTSLCVSVDVMLGKEAGQFLKRLADHLSMKLETSYSRIIGWVRTQFSILRASVLRLRGACTKWRTLDIMVGTAIPKIMD